MRWLRRLYRFTQQTSATTRRSQQRARPHLEGLETRLAPASVFVVPVSVPEDSTHFHGLGTAVAVAGTNGTVTVEPGAVPSSVGFGMNGITIQGDPNTPASILPRYDLQILAHNVTLRNLNLGTVTIGQTEAGDTKYFQNSISKCAIVYLKDLGVSSTITQNTFTGALQILGKSQAVQGDVITNNTFSADFAGDMLEINFGFGTQVTGNTFYGDGVSNGIVLTNCSGSSSAAPTTVAHNTFSLTPSMIPLPVGILVQQDGSNVSNVNVACNQIDTGGAGTGVSMTMVAGDALHFTAVLEGNDLHNNAVGLSVSGAGQFCGDVDAGGGPTGGKGGNDFRGFTTQADASHGAIVLMNAPSGDMFAQHNLFRSGVMPSSVVFAASGGIDVSKPLTDPQAFVQALYIEVLGRTGSLGELDGWVGALNQQGQAAVVNAILRSGEALGRIVDAFYLRFLGRQADANGRSGWISFLQHGGTEEQLENLFLTSPEYINNIGTDFVQSLYLNILGRSGDTGGLSFWNNQIQALGLAGIANGFTASGEGRQNVLRSTFRAFLHRTPSNAELAPLVNSSQDLLSLAALVLSSPEFFTNG